MLIHSKRHRSESETKPVIVYGPVRAVGKRPSVCIRVLQRGAVVGRARRQAARRTGRTIRGREVEDLRGRSVQNSQCMGRRSNNNRTRSGAGRIRSNRAAGRGSRMTTSALQGVGGHETGRQMDLNRPIPNPERPQ